MRRIEIVTGGLSIGLVLAGALGMAEYIVNSQAQRAACYYNTYSEYGVCKTPNGVELNNIIDEENLVFGGLGLLSAAVGTVGLWTTYYMMEAREGAEAYIIQSGQGTAPNTQ